MPVINKKISIFVGLSKALNKKQEDETHIIDFKAGK